MAVLLVIGQSDIQNCVQYDTTAKRGCLECKSGYILRYDHDHCISTTDTNLVKFCLYASNNNHAVCQECKEGYKVYYATKKSNG